MLTENPVVSGLQLNTDPLDTSFFLGEGGVPSTAVVVNAYFLASFLHHIHVRIVVVIHGLHICINSLPFLGICRHGALWP
jgi:hypothetical protein